MGPAAEFFRVPHHHDADDVGILLAEEHHRADIPRLVDRHLVAGDRKVGHDHRVDVGLDRVECLAVEPLMVREVEMEFIGPDFRALLFGMRAEPAPERQVNQVSGAVRPRNRRAARRVDLCQHDFPRLHLPFEKRAGVYLELAVVFGRVDPEPEIPVRNHAGVADLPPLLGVEGGPVQDQRDSALIPRGRRVGRLPVPEDGEDFGVPRREGPVSQEDRRFGALFERFERVVLEQEILFGQSGKLAVALHLFFEPVPVEPVPAFRGEGLEEFRREPVGLIHLERVPAGNDRLGRDRIEDVFDPAQSPFDRSEEMLLFGPDHLLNALDRPAQFGIGNLHQFGDGRHQFKEERFLFLHLESVENGAAQKAADDVLFLLVAGIDVFMNREGARADMVGDPAQTAAVFVRQILIVVFHAADLAGGEDERFQNVDMEVRRDPLERGGGPFEPHAGIDVLARERFKVVRRIPDAVELREDEVPDFDLAQRRVIVDLAARAADAVRPFRRGAGGPEVFVLVEVLQAVGGKLDFVEPDFRGLGVVFIDRRRKRFGGEPEPFLFGEEFPRPVNRLAFEIVAETEIAEHFEEGVVIRRSADVVDIAGPQALLAGRRAGKVEMAPAEEMVLELVHPGGGEEDRRVPAGDEHVARAAHAPFGFKEGKVLFTKFVGFHCGYLCCGAGREAPAVCRK